ncbi:ROK family protein [Microbacterium sp. NPDC058389]|uniref:ROK family transcriptional regulator n=1 Tax=Microbacterium sp. NPDC058389 TaxID=3346475 RepID=UPI00366829B5
MKYGPPSALRTLNEGAVLHALFERGALTRPEIEEITGLSKPAAARLLLRVEEAGIVRRAGEKASKHGPAAVLWDIVADASLVAGISVRAEQLWTDIADLRGTVVASAAVPNEVRGPDEVGPQVRHAVEAALSGTGIAHDRVADITLGLPGVVEPVGGRLTHGAQLPAWVDVDIIGAVRAEMPHVDVFTSNDVALVAVAAHEVGESAGAEDFALLWLDRGIRAVYVRRGEVLLGAHGSSGEIGALPVPAGIPGAADLPLAAVPGTRLEELLSPAAVAGLGDDVDAIAARVALAGAVVLAAYDPDLILLAGSVADRYEGLATAVRSELTFMPNAIPPVAHAPGGARAVATGAIRLSLRNARARALGQGSSAAADDAPLQRTYGQALAGRR